MARSGHSRASGNPVFPWMLPCLAAALSSATAAAMVGGAQPPPEGPARAAVILVGPAGSCTGVALTRNLVLTAAHCVPPGAEVKLLEFDAARQPVLKDVATIARH